MSASETFDLIVVIFHDVLSIDKNIVTLQSKFRSDLNMDSLDLVEFTMAVENVFEIEISDYEAINIITVGDLVAYLDAKG